MDFVVPVGSYEELNQNVTQYGLRWSDAACLVADRFQSVGFNRRSDIAPADPPLAADPGSVFDGAYQSSDVFGVALTDLGDGALLKMRSLVRMQAKEQRPALSR
jgi:hypothetical protein